MKIYMDVCCLNRPFDDLSQLRVFFENEAVLSIISYCDSGEWVLCSSSIIDYEVAQISDSEKHEKVIMLYSSASEHIEVTQDLTERAKQFQECGIKYFDSLHIALAESAKADVLLTTDDRLIKLSRKTNANIKVENPVKWLMEVISDE